MARLNITVPDELYERLERWRDHVNLSRVCQEALTRELDKLEELPAELHRMRQTLSRLGQEKAKVDRACFRKGVYDGLEWARQADYPTLKQWGEHAPSGDSLRAVVRGPAANSVTAHASNPAWEPLPYAEGWLAGVRQFWDRAKKHL